MKSRLMKPISFLFYDQDAGNVREGLVLIFSHFFLFTGILLIAEFILIFLGLCGVALPFSGSVYLLVEKLVF